MYNSGALLHRYKGNYMHSYAPAGVVQPFYFRLTMSPSITARNFFRFGFAFATFFPSILWMNVLRLSLLRYGAWESYLKIILRLILFCFSVWEFCDCFSFILVLIFQVSGNNIYSLLFYFSFLRLGNFGLLSFWYRYKVQICLNLLFRDFISKIRNLEKFCVILC